MTAPPAPVRLTILIFLALLLAGCRSHPKVTASPITAENLPALAAQTPTPAPDTLANGWYVYTDPAGTFSFGYPTTAVISAGQNPTDGSKNILIQFLIPDQPYQGMSIRIEPNPKRLGAADLARQLYAQSMQKPASAAFTDSLQMLQVGGASAVKASIPASNTELTVFISYDVESFIVAPVHGLAATKVEPETLALFYQVLNTLKFGISPARAGSAAIALEQSVPIAKKFSLPLGYRDGVSYGPRINYRNGKLIEDSEYGVKNPDMQGSTCFGLDWGQLYHSGEDWYRSDGKSTANAEVTAVAAGNVKYISYDFPGAVIIIRHKLPPDGTQKVFSLYGHLDPNSVQVSVGQVVTRGQTLGKVLLQYYDGRYTASHDDSHLHFELRDFYDGSNIYPDYPYCNGYVPGRGYTYPSLPDIFPSTASHYTDPIAYILRRPWAYLPFLVR